MVSIAAARCDSTEPGESLQVERLAEVFAPDMGHAQHAPTMQGAQNITETPSIAVDFAVLLFYSYNMLLSKNFEPSEMRLKRRLLQNQGFVSF